MRYAEEVGGLVTVSTLHGREEVVIGLIGVRSRGEIVLKPTSTLLVTWLRHGRHKSIGSCLLLLLLLLLMLMQLLMLLLLLLMLLLTLIQWWTLNKRGYIQHRLQGLQLRLVRLVHRLQLK